MGTKGLLRHGGMARLFDGIRALSTLGTFLRLFTFGQVRQLDAVAARLLIQLVTAAPVLPESISSCYPAAAASICTVACGGGDLSRTSALYGGQTCGGRVSSGEASSALPSTSLPAGMITIGGDLTVGRMGFGAMQLTGDQVWGEYPDHDGALLLLRHVVDAGVNFLDTADVYGPHSNEELIREALHPYPADLVIATKGGFVRGGYDYSTLGAVGNPNYLRQSLHMSLRRLGLARIDLYYLHSGRATDAPFEDQVGVLAELRAQGLIRHIGLSNVTVEQFETAREIVEIAALTANYNLGTRTGSAHLSAAERTGVVFSPWGPTRFDGPHVEHVRATVDDIAQRHGATAQQVALAWHLHRSPNTLPIPGTRTISHFDANIGAARIGLSAEEVGRLTDLTPENNGETDS